MVDRAGIVRVRRSPHRDPRPGEHEHDRRGDRGDRDKDGVTTYRLHGGDASNAPHEHPAFGRNGVQAMRIQTVSDPTVVVAVDTNCPRVRATAPKRYEPGAAPAVER